MTLPIVLCLVAGVAQGPPKFAPWPDPAAAVAAQEPGAPPAPKPPPPPPDVIELNNGDKVTGQVQKMIDGKLVVKTTYAGDVTIAWKEIKSIQLGSSLPIQLKNSDAVKGKLLFSGDGMHVFETDDLALRGPVKLDSIVAINEPPPKWTGFLTLGISVARGNTESTVLSGSAEAKHETKKDLFKAYGRFQYEDNQDGVAAQNNALGALYDYYFTERWFVEGFGELSHDQFQDLDIRLKVGASIGYAFVKETDMRLTGDVGAAWIDDHYRSNAPDNSYASLKFGEAFSWKISESQSISQLVQVFPNTERFKDTLMHFEASYHNLLGIGGLFLDTTAIDDYDNQPVDGTERNDFKLIASLGLKF